MSTSAVVPSSTTLSAMPLKSETINYAVIGEYETTKNPDGTTAVNTTKVEKYTLTSSVKEVANVKAAAGGSKFVAVEQAVAKPVVGTMDGFNELYPNEKDKLIIINKGISKNFEAKIRTYLLETDETGQQLTYQFTDGVLDATYIAQDVATSRTKLSPEEVAINALSKLGLSEDVIKGILAQVAASSSAA